jgi:N-methylhydantoinase B/oxoprolinase/acetone carboxylase alpha subunit
MLKGFSSSAPRTTLADVQAEIASLSEAERQLVLNDIYGKSPAFDETEELVVSALAALEQCIEATPHSTRTSYDRARVECPLYVNDRSFRLMFLRREFFVAEVSRV